jgi:predicted DNA-binding protein
MTATGEKTEITLVISRETDQHLARLAMQLGREKNDIATEALVEWLDDLEDVEAASKVLSQRNPSFPLEEAWRMLELDD